MPAPASEVNVVGENRGSRQEGSTMQDPARTRRKLGIRLPRRRSTRLLAGAVVLAALFAPTTLANHLFTDVPAASPHHNDVTIINRAGITGGCGPGLYCPTQFVQRDQMASFVARTLRALTPVFRTDTGGGSAVDIDAEPVVCQTGTFTPTVAATARMDSWISLVPAASAQMTFFVRNVFSTNGGTTWLNADSAAVARADSHLAGAWGHGTNSAVLALSAGTTYIFGVQTGRIGGTTDASDSRCEVITEITYSDAGASSIGAGPVTNDQAPAKADGS